MKWEKRGEICQWGRKRKTVVLSGSKNVENHVMKCCSWNLYSTKLLEKCLQIQVGQNNPLSPLDYYSGFRCI